MQGTDAKSKTEDKESEQSPQDRLEKVWTTLGLPDSHKLDMAIKYSSDHYHSLLQDVSTINAFRKHVVLYWGKET